MPALESGVEVDEVDPVRTRFLPTQCRLDRVAEALLGPVDTPHQSDGRAGLDVDGGEELELVGHEVDRPAGALA